jgi:hypothetical protein
VTDRAAVEGSGKRADNVAHDEVDSLADGRSPPARAEEVAPELMSSSRAIGPLTSMKTAEPPVLVAGPWYP